jgi:flagellar hook-associated protein 2
VPLDRAGAAIIATNGSAANGSVAVNGVRVNYDVSTQTIGSIVASLDSALAASDGGSAVLNADGTVTLTGVITLGSGADSGNLLHVLKIDTALISAGVVTSSSTIAGLNEYSALNLNGNGGFSTAVTAGSFTINGVSFTVDPTRDTLAAVIARISASNAGVVAGFNSETSALTLTNKTPGPQSILLGVAADTSNFLSASGLTSGTTITGTQASLTYTNAQGAHTVYSSTNEVTSAIPGITLGLTASSPASLPPGSTFYTVNVAPDSTKAETAIGTFIKAYNAVIDELNKDTVAPTVTVGHSATTNTSTSAERTAGGVLYSNYSISRLRDQLVGLVSGFIPSGSSAYNSLASLGILLDTNSQSVGANDADGATNADASPSSGNAFSVNSTSGQLAALDLAKFRAAYAANTAVIGTLFTSAPAPRSTANAGSETAGFAYQIGNLIANADGLVTFLTGRIVAPANISSVLLKNVTTENLAQISSLQRQIDLIDREATQQADSLRAQFNASETHIAQLLALQAQIAAIGH